jgi:hypothetical protein
MLVPQSAKADFVLLLPRIYSPGQSRAEAELHQHYPTPSQSWPTT